MLTKEERKKLNTDFYTALGVMMKHYPSETGRKIKWTNYKTGVKDIFVRMYTDHNGATFSIDLQHRDKGVRELMWEQLEEFKMLLESELGEELIWHENYMLPNGMEISRVEVKLQQGSLFDKSTWLEILSFYKRNLLGFDTVWANCFDIFKALEN